MFRVTGFELAPVIGSNGQSRCTSYGWTAGCRLRAPIAGTRRNADIHGWGFLSGMSRCDLLLSRCYTQWRREYKIKYRKSYVKFLT